MQYRSKCDSVAPKAVGDNPLLESGVQSKGKFRSGAVRKTTIAVTTVLLVAAACRMLYTKRWQVWPKRFAVVEQGWLYRSGQIDAGLIDDVVSRYAISAILAAKWMDPSQPDVAAELAVAKKKKLDYLEIPMPGSGAGSIEDLENAADWIAAHKDHPILVHCDAGQQRSGASIAAYRMAHCGWTLNEALAEARRFGLRDRHGELIARLAEFYEHVVRTESRKAADGEARPKR